MKVLTLTLRMENDAFVPNHAHEASAILLNASLHVKRGRMKDHLFDCNGNHCGEWAIVEQRSKRGANKKGGR